MATELKLAANDAVEFGRAVAVSGDYVIVGAREPTMGFSDNGHAYIFAKNGSGWTQQTKLSPSVRQQGSDYFGTAVAIDGDYAIVGAPNSLSGEDGWAYVFHRQGSNWMEQSVLVPGDPTPDGNFGRSVAISGDWAIVGSSHGAYLFQRAGSTWTQQTKVTGTGADFGQSVALSGNYAVVGSFNSSSAYVFRRNGTTWQQQTILTASDGTSDNHFGWSVSISANYIIVGAFGATANSQAGAAYIFEGNGSVWVEQAKLEPGAVTQQGVKRFGQSVAISGGYAAVGDPSDDDIAPGSGAVYVYQRQGLAWPLLEKIIASDAALFDAFGTWVAIDGSVAGGHALVGTPDHQEGVAYLFSNFPASFGQLIDPSRYSIYAKILFGLTGGGGGVVWLPGSGPVPVDPEPFKTWSALSPTKRDLLVGLALSELANLISDGRIRQEMRMAGVKLVKQAAGELRVSDVTERF